MDCSIIIITFNTREMTMNCIADLLTNPPRKTFEIIVVDNASSDGTSDAVGERFPSVRVLRNSHNLGFSKACNRGAKQAKGRHYCFLNSDTLSAGRTLDELVDYLDHHPLCGIVGPEFRSASHELIQMSWGWDPIMLKELVQQFFAPYALRRSAVKRHLVEWLQRETRAVEILCGACIVVRRETFDQIGGFDEGFELYFEDSDLCRRARSKGWSVVFFAEAHVIHHLGQSTQESWGLTPLVYRQSQIYFYRKYAAAWCLPVLKLYLWLKWFRLWTKSVYLRAERERIHEYLDLMSRIIRESEKVRLSGDYFKTQASST